MTGDSILEQSMIDKGLLGDIVHDNLTHVDDAVPGNVGKSSCKKTGLECRVLLAKKSDNLLQNDLDSRFHRKEDYY